MAPPTLLSPAIVNEIVNFDASVERKIDIEEGDSVPTPPKGILKKQSAARLGQVTVVKFVSWLYNGGDQTEAGTKIRSRKRSLEMRLVPANPAPFPYQLIVPTWNGVLPRR